LEENVLNNLLRTSIVILAEAEQTGPFTAEDFVDKLFPSGFLWGAVTQILAFLVLILIVWKLLYNPVKKIFLNFIESFKYHHNRLCRHKSRKTRTGCIIYL